MLGSNPRTCRASAVSTCANCGAIGSSSFSRLPASSPARILTPMVGSVYGRRKRVSTPKPMFTLDHAASSAMMFSMKSIVAGACALLFAVGCGQQTGDATTRRIESFIAANQLRSALEAIESRHKQEPSDLSCLRLRVLVLLKAAQPADALLALNALPASDPVLSQ